MTELFIKLVARAQAGKLYLNIAIRLQAGEPDHLAGELGNLHRFAHVQNENLTALSERAALQNQADSFGNGHKKPNHVGMGNCDWAALGDLALEDGNHAARRAEHIAKP